MNNSWIENTLAGLDYNCDRCRDLGKITPLGRIEYDLQVRYDEQGNPLYRYCKKCWDYLWLRWIHCSCGAKYTLRTEELVWHKECACGRKYEVYNRNI